MDTNQMPPVQQAQPMQSVAGTTPAQTMQPGSAAANPQGGVKAGKASKKHIDKQKLIMILMGVVIAILLGLACTFIALFVLKDDEYTELQENTNLLIEEAVSNAKTEQALADAEEAKKDTRQFTGPSDYGQVSFDYPKLWSLYVEADAAKGGDYVAYFNPIEIEPVNKSTVYALRIIILNKTFEAVTAEYQKYLDRGMLSMETITVDSETANRYVGNIPSTDLQGIIVIFKVRDKTVILRTDSMLYEKDFEKILASVKYNK